MQIIDTSDQQNGDDAVDIQFPENVIVFSHLRWDFVFQRPQHLLTRLSANANVFFIEEPVFEGSALPAYNVSKRGENIWLLVPHFPADTPGENIKPVLKTLFSTFMDNIKLTDYAFWYYTPMALEFSRRYIPATVIYDCMDELSAFAFAPPALHQLEKELLQTADIVFTGGRSLYEAKKNQHANIHPFPSSIETGHFAKARNKGQAPNAGKRKVKLGFSGVIDERFDIDLIREIADRRPEWEIELIGPVVKIDSALLPANPNITYPGAKSYSDLPACLSNWDIALIPFLLNDSTKFISPTKTPEYLAAGLPVVSTPINDVVHPYGRNQLVHIAKNADEFIAAVEQELDTEPMAKKAWLNKADIFLSQNSWDKTYLQMFGLIKKTIHSKQHSSIAQ